MPSQEPESQIPFSSAHKNDKGFFKPFFNSFLKSVTPDQHSAFAKLTDDEDRIKFVNQILPECADVVQDKGSKDLKLATKLKERGTAEFVRGDTLKAVLSYTEAILKTPFENEVELAVTVGNRSAALYHLEKFEEALQDIEYADKSSYPKELRYKLYDRRSRCLLGLKKHDDAVASFRKTLQALDDSKLPTEKKLKMQKDIQIMFGLLGEGKTNKQHLNTLVAGKTKQVESRLLPDLAGKRNINYPALSEWVTIKKEDGVGRFAVATRDIAAGETVLVENSAASVLLAEHVSSHCQHCFKRTTSPLPCQTCAMAVFCSPACQDQARSYHQYECTYAAALYKSGVSVIILMSLRVITQKSLQFFLDIRPKLKQTPEEVLKKYRSDDYLAFHHLVRHEDQRPAENFFERSAIAVTLLRCLKKSGYFGVQTALGSTLSDEEAYIGGLLLRHTQIMQFNAHEIAELEADTSESLDRTESLFIAGGIYPTLALLNHSCNPGIVRYNLGTSIVVKTIRPISKGEELSENYGPIFTTKKKLERQTELRAHYWFDCNCQPCKEDWPMLTEMDKMIIPFRCAGNSEPPCSGVIRVSNNTEEFMLKCDVCGQFTNLLKGLKAIQDTDAMFRQALNDTNCGKIQSAMALYLEILSLLHKHLAPPFNDYHMCQQAIRKCMVRMGNVNIKEL